MFDINTTIAPDTGGLTRPVAFKGLRGFGFRLFKRSFDIVAALLLLPTLIIVGVALAVLNPLFNRGRLIFVQERMGRDTVPFRAYKFRTMIDVPEIRRGAFDALESDRITTLGRHLRRSRLDELPQIINVLKGEMSMIGPRPDYLPHARQYLVQVAGYRDRHILRPGITGFAQVTHGYVDGLEGVRAKVDADLTYIESASIRLDFWICWQTVLTVLRGGGR
jgi:lipopolysaccharide/colanic/teichoic acid biosynthesis glycosyltransferase